MVSFYTKVASVAVLGLALAGGTLTDHLPRRAVAADTGRDVAARCAHRAQARLYFGLHGPAGEVSTADWEWFLAGVITPRFPSGLTILEARGQWRGGSHGVEREPTRIVEIVHDASPQATEAIDHIVAIYKTRYGQEAVMVAHSKLDVCFQ
jgi:hypothetical protein